MALPRLTSIPHGCPHGSQLPRAPLPVYRACRCRLSRCQSVLTQSLAGIPGSFGILLPLSRSSEHRVPRPRGRSLCRLNRPMTPQFRGRTTARFASDAAGATPEQSAFGRQPTTCRENTRPPVDVDGSPHRAQLAPRLSFHTPFAFVSGGDQVFPTSSSEQGYGRANSGS